MVVFDEVLFLREARPSIGRVTAAVSMLRMGRLGDVHIPDVLSAVFALSRIVRYWRCHYVDFTTGRGDELMACIKEALPILRKRYEGHTILVAEIGRLSALLNTTPDVYGENDHV